MEIFARQRAVIFQMHAGASANIGRTRVAGRLSLQLLFHPLACPTCHDFTFEAHRLCRYILQILQDLRKTSSDKPRSRTVSCTVAPVCLRHGSSCAAVVAATVGPLAAITAQSQDPHRTWWACVDDRSEGSVWLHPGTRLRCTLLAAGIFSEAFLQRQQFPIPGPCTPTTRAQYSRQLDQLRPCSALELC